MSSAAIRACPVIACQPWPRHVVPPEQWALVGGDIALQALWGDTAEVYALFLDEAAQPLLASTPVHDGRYPALSRRFPAAAALERMVRDLWGHEADGAEDARPWLDHGRWRLTRPLAARHGPGGGDTEPVFRPVPGDWMQLPIGPVDGSLAEPAHLRAHLAGDRVAALEARLGYAHKGSLQLMRGKSPRAAARFAARLSADATVAHSLAFARAAEVALGVEAPPRAVILRGIMAETERIAIHLGDLAAACAARPRLATQLGVHREAMLRASAVAWGHRMMMDCVTPGGLVADIAAPGPAALAAAVADLPSPDRLLDGLGEGVGVVPAAALAAFAPGGVAGRAAGSPADARRWPGYPPYAAFPSATLTGADVAARLRVRLLEIPASVDLLLGWLGELPPGPVAVALPMGSGEGLAVAESPRGPAWHWMRLDGGLIGAAFAADPSWLLWPLQEAASVGAAAGDLRLIDRSFACARSGVDL